MSRQRQLNQGCQMKFTPVTGFRPNNNWKLFEICVIVLSSLQTESPMTQEAYNIPKSLIDALKAGQVVPFVGAGF